MCNVVTPYSTKRPVDISVMDTYPCLTGTYPLWVQIWISPLVSMGLPMQFPRFEELVYNTFLLD